MKKTLALLLALMLCMTAFGCSSVQSISNDKQTSHESADKLTKGSSLSVKTTEIPEPTVEPTAEPTPEPTAEPTKEQIPMDVLAPLPEPAPTYDYEQMIIDLFEHINKGDITGFANSFTPTVREEELKEANEWNKEHGEYYYNFKHVDILDIAKVNERYCRPDSFNYPQLDDLLLDTDNFDCYYVQANVDVFDYIPGSWYAAGERGFIVTIIKEAGEWYIGTVMGYDPDNILNPGWMKHIDEYYDNMDK